MLFFLILPFVLAPILTQNLSDLIGIINNPNSEWNMMEDYLNDGTMVIL